MGRNKHSESYSSSESEYEPAEKCKYEYSQSCHNSYGSENCKQSYKKYFKALNGWWCAKQQLLSTACNAVVQYSTYYIWRQVVSYGKHKQTALYQEIIFIDPAIAGVPANYPPANPQWVALVGQGSAVVVNGAIQATTRYLNGDAVLTYYWNPNCPYQTVSDGIGANTNPSSPSGYTNIGNQKKAKALPGFKCQNFATVYQTVCQNPPNPPV